MAVVLKRKGLWLLIETKCAPEAFLATILEVSYSEVKLNKAKHRTQSGLMFMGGNSLELIYRMRTQ